MHWVREILSCDLTLLRCPFPKTFKSLCSDTALHPFHKPQSSLLELASLYKDRVPPLHPLSSRRESVRKECGEGAEQVQPPCFSRLFLTHLLKACVKGAVFALEELLPAMLVPVMTPDALDVARGEFTEFTVENSFAFLLSNPSSSRKRHRADTAVVPRQSRGLIVVQLLLNIWRL